MSGIADVEQLSCGPVSVVRLKNHDHSKPYAVEDVAQWLAMADRTNCRTLVVDCSNVEFMSSAMLSKLVILQRRMRENRGELVLCHLRAEVRELLEWTKLDSFFNIEPEF